MSKNKPSPNSNPPYPASFINPKLGLQASSKQVKTFLSQTFPIFESQPPLTKPDFKLAGMTKLCLWNHDLSSYHLICNLGVSS